jgi:hypothetical protein
MTCQTCPRTEPVLKSLQLSATRLKDEVDRTAEPMPKALKRPTLDRLGPVVVDFGRAAAALPIDLSTDKVMSVGF